MIAVAVQLLNKYMAQVDAQIEAAQRESTGEAAAAIDDFRSRFRQQLK
jgi:hypothetical protein